METRYPIKVRGRLGPREDDEKSIRILNRIVTWTEEGIEYEADQRHVEIVAKDLQLKTQSRSVGTPAEKNPALGKTEKLEPNGATKYRANVARLNYVTQDRTDISYAVKELSSEMSEPTTDSWAKLKRAGRYLLCRPRYILLYKYQELPKGLTVWTDSDFAGCRKSRKSTSGGVIQLGSHVG